MVDTESFAGLIGGRSPGGREEKVNDSRIRTFESRKYNLLKISKTLKARRGVPRRRQRASPINCDLRPRALVKGPFRGGSKGRSQGHSSTSFSREHPSGVEAKQTNVEFE